MQAVKQHTVKIPVDLPSALVCRRRLVNKYETNREIRAVGVWLLLKSLTTTGLIQRYSRQLPWLCAYTQLSKASFYRKLKDLEQMGLLVIDGRNIGLNSWHDLGELYGITCNNFYEVNYDHEDKKAIHWLITACEIEYNKERQRLALGYKLDKNPELKIYLEAILKKAGVDPGADPRQMFDQLWKLQLLSFHDNPGTEIYLTLDCLRFDVNRARKGFKKCYHFKSEQSASYWRGKLASTGIATVERLAVISGHRARKNKLTYVRWLQTDKQTIWYGCNQISITPGIIKDACRQNIFRNAA